MEKGVDRIYERVPKNKKTKKQKKKKKKKRKKKKNLCKNFLICNIYHTS